MAAAKETTLDELGEMLTHVVEHMATKEDVARLDDRLSAVETRLTSIESKLTSIRRDLDDLRQEVDNVSGFRKEIDHALERIAAATTTDSESNQRILQRYNRSHPEKAESRDRSETHDPAHSQRDVINWSAVNRLPNLVGAREPAKVARARRIVGRASSPR
jgi:chromosome segregation ATPase